MLQYVADIGAVCDERDDAHLVTAVRAQQPQHLVDGVAQASNPSGQIDLAQALIDTVARFPGRPLAELAHNNAPLTQALNAAQAQTQEIAHVISMTKPVFALP